MNQENTDFVLEKSPPAPPDNTAQISASSKPCCSLAAALTVSELRKVFDRATDLVRTRSMFF